MIRGPEMYKLNMEVFTEREVLLLKQVDTESGRKEIRPNAKNTE